MTAEERRRGRLKVFLGAAAGVGRTFAMLGELVRRAARMARRSGGPLYVLHVEPSGEREPDGVHRAVEAAEELGRQLGATVLRRTGDVAATVVATAGELAVNQIVLGESHRPRWKELVGRSIIARILRETDGVDVHIIADRGGRSDGPQR
jgi:two-component system sensor histidine kinase KdpD